MIMTPTKLIIPALLAVLSLDASAQHQTLSLDPVTSQVGFALGGSGHHVQGIFHVQSGSIAFDPTARSISGSVVVSAASGNSGEASRDKKMNSDILNTEKFSQITFEPKSYTGNLSSSGDSSIQVSGVFTLHGSPHDITVPMQIHMDGANLTAKGQFTVPYVQWGLKDPSIFVLKVAKEVQIDLTLTGHISQ
jgi:polyisoprenoid-binding protein YceI